MYMEKLYSTVYVQVGALFKSEVFRSSLTWDSPAMKFA
jgi:hypothetical protein